VPHHPLDDVPAQALVVAHQPLERARHVAEHVRDQRAIGVQGQPCLRAMSQ
jgi:hypothetical protein